ncbi:hypothetical protein P692DRAFT_20757435, partial [Suillus brevipes Sb2]
CNVQSQCSPLYHTERKRAQTVAALAHEVAVPDLRCLIRYFLFSQLNPDDARNPKDIPAASLP